MGPEGVGGGAAGCICEPCGEQAQANRVTSVRTARADTEIRMVTNYSLSKSRDAGIVTTHPVSAATYPARRGARLPRRQNQNGGTMLLTLRI